MRDDGPNQAIKVEGGVSEFVRDFGVSQFSSAQRPSQYDEYKASDEVDEVESARAQEYAMLSVLLARAPDAALLSRLAGLRGDATPLGVAHVALAEAASKASVEQIEREFFDLFIGIGRGELMPYGSFYLTGFLHERPLMRLRADLIELGIERSEGHAEPEDHAATLCEIMAGLADGRFGGGIGARMGTDQGLRPPPFACLRRGR